MSAEGAERQRMSVAQWRDLERTGEVSHDYIDGYVYPIMGGSRAHSASAADALAMLHAALGAGSCQVYTSGVATRVSASRYTYADVVVTCAADDQATRADTEVVEPRVVIEALSKSTEGKDRSRKWDDYRRAIGDQAGQRQARRLSGRVRLRGSGALSHPGRSP